MTTSLADKWNMQSNSKMPKVLTDLCLQTIVDCFPRYNLAFNTTEEDAMKRRFEFLRELIDEYVDLLINKHLKELDTVWFRDCTWKKITSKIPEIGSSVETVHFSEYDVTEKTPWQDMMCYFPNLRSFSFPFKSCTDVIVKLVANFCRNIEEINIESSLVTSEGVKYLLKNENGEALCLKLKKLYIGCTLIKDDAVKHLLKNLPSLEVLGYVKLPVVLHSMHKNDLTSLDKVERYNITEMNFVGFEYLPYFDDIKKVCFSVCPHLKSLTYVFRKSDDLNLISNLSELEHLCVQNLRMSQKMNVDGLLKSVGGKLTSLTLIGCSISVSVLFESCPRIEDLTVDEVDIEFDKTPKSTFYSLHSLTFQQCSISQNIKAISLLLSSPSEKWEKLTFFWCELLSSEIKAEILKCCETHPIKELNFSQSEVEKEYIKYLLLNCSNLSVLDIDYCFDPHVCHELLEFAAVLPNKPKIFAGGRRHDEDYYDSDDNNY